MNFQVHYRDIEGLLRLEPKQPRPHSVCSKLQYSNTATKEHVTCDCQQSGTTCGFRSGCRANANAESFVCSKPFVNVSILRGILAKNIRFLLYWYHLLCLHSGTKVTNRSTHADGYQSNQDVLAAKGAEVQEVVAWFSFWNVKQCLSL